MASQFNESEAVAGRQVIIQVGSQDIADGVPNEEISAAVQALWQTVNDRGGRPIASLLPPSDSFPADTLTVNNLIQAAAVAQGVALIDVTTPVAAPDGTWASGYSDDGVEPNASGISAMAEAAAAQLPGLVGVPNVAG
jgi:lysophospholipase L1-like esterase